MHVIKTWASKYSQLTNLIISWNWDPSFFGHRLKRRELILTDADLLIDHWLDIYYRPPSLCHSQRYFYMWFHFQLKKSKQVNEQKKNARRNNPVFYNYCWKINIFEKMCLLYNFSEFYEERQRSHTNNRNSKGSINKNYLIYIRVSTWLDKLTNFSDIENWIFF